MAQSISRFNLPRLDWYDADGRIYKDALVENFNAIEAKLLELSCLDVFHVEQPDWDNILLEDTTLDSEDNRIVNLRSLVNIMNLTHLPIEVNISGKKIKKASYYGSDGNIHAVTNKDLSGSLSQSTPWVFIDTQSNTAITSSNAMLDLDRYILIGVYVDDYRIAPVFEQHCDYDALKALSNMPIEYSTTFTTHTNAQQRWRKGKTDDRIVAHAEVNKHHCHNIENVYYDYGRPDVADRALNQYEITPGDTYLDKKLK